ncbi:hypothetical protein SLEP1_g18411 [Rubroshorea leprosula]|uniref:Uncharacterized protein n=1 Tax=Rubroshorea leprosula TaxID=152421 RepID=A0AAV5IXF2_9ROSI|nr:hypothetical protein SLEP1_g18411 [Rubroshorea leprosula]
MDTSLRGVTIIRRYLYEDDLIVNLLCLHELRGECHFVAEFFEAFYLALLCSDILPSIHIFY